MTQDHHDAVDARRGSSHARADSSTLIGGHPLPVGLRDVADPALVAWRDRLPGTVEAVLEAWELIPEAPFQPGGSSAWVAPVRAAQGAADGASEGGGDGAAEDADLVLKVAWAHEESRDEAAGMRVWQGRGVARLHRAEWRGDTSVLLLERVRPGTPLSELLTGPERDEVVAGLLRRLWMPVPAGAEFRPLADMCEGWAESARRRAEVGANPLPPALVEHGLGLFRDLPRQWDGEPMLLATDLHPGNVLRARGESGGWAVIDPKPYAGDPHYDLLQHMLNDPGRLRSSPSPFADRMARLAGLDPARARRWLLARCVQEAGVFDAAAPAALRLAADGVG
ncbi:aminoglycoside phosphotransferase family protein [Brachybacterium aquaticum]|uniref:Streptomycin 6-kinase n=1 Tax=Brachybacterium aquaticum TaxID=1432564 RepID=A0A841AGS7_9MICO|nr:aminoglycoside phosphotransferase family protein [Brachybacterium aquaticum]MBB5833137.1 streptomycin 6-kinase [Brachybacterium aquaticum]